MGWRLRRRWEGAEGAYSLVPFVPCQEVRYAFFCDWLRKDGSVDEDGELVVGRVGCGWEVVGLWLDCHGAHPEGTALEGTVESVDRDRLIALNSPRWVRLSTGRVYLPQLLNSL